MHNRRLELGCRAIQNRPFAAIRHTNPLPPWRFLHKHSLSHIPIRKLKVLVHLAKKAAEKYEREERDAEDLLNWRRQAPIFLEHLKNPDKPCLPRYVHEDAVFEMHVPRFKKVQNDGNK